MENSRKVNLIQLAGAPIPGYRYVCGKCNEVLLQADVDIDGDGGLRHQGDVDADADGFFPMWCGPVFQEPFHMVETCVDPRCEEPACLRQREHVHGDILYDQMRDCEEDR